jgi:DtxR family Mn-dependent transcriptional regulator
MPVPSAHNAHSRRGIGESAENSLKAIYNLQGRDEGPVNTGALAERLGVTPASASAMLKRLADEGLVEHTPYHGVRLTDRGEQVALEVIRHHRLLEMFLAEVLDMPWDQVHDEAEVLEHYISEELEERMSSVLGDPRRDPHGDPIPSVELDLPDAKTVALADLGPGRGATFTRVSDSDPAMLRYLAERGIRPGARLRVTGEQPFGGPLYVEVDGREHALGDELAGRMRVEVEEEAG